MLLLHGGVGQGSWSFSHELSGEVEGVGVVHQPIEEGIGQGGFVEIGVPGGHGELTDDHGGLAVVAIVEEFEQVAASLGGERGQAPVIEDQELGFGVVAQQLGIATVGTSQR